MVDLKAKPFYLSDADIQWVESTLAAMTLAEKIGQLFCPVGFTTSEKDLLHLIRDRGICGIMYRTGTGKDVQRVHRFIQENAKIPMLLAANLEAGGIGIAADGTNFGKPLQAAAADDDEMGYYLGRVSCAEGAAVGCNWSFAPIVDIDMNFRNPITNLRTFGASADKVLRMGMGYLRGADESGLAVSIKHFPGDGVDERDQHLLTSVNSLSADAWDESYGKIYQGLIDAGAKTVMVGHITQPAWTRKLNPNIQDEDIMPGTLSPELMQGLLRGKLGFNGVISTDATPMLGFTTAMRRQDAVPASIAAGADVFLFNKDFDEDYTWMMQGYENGVITPERLDEALIRILGLKASLGLHEKQKNGTLVPGEEALSVLGCPQHRQWAAQCADKSVTLVKDTQKLLPLSAKKHPRVYINVMELSDAIDSPLRQKIKTLFEKEGFQVTLRNRDTNIDLSAALTGGEMSPRAQEVLAEAFCGVDGFCKQYDLVVYFSNFETASNNTVVRLNWRGMMGMGNDAPWFVREVPTLYVSLANPYHLLDVPMMKTFINAYTCNDDVLHSVMERLMGRASFTGVSPVDPFCGKWDTTL